LSENRQKVFDKKTKTGCLGCLTIIVIVVIIAVIATWHNNGAREKAFNWSGSEITVDTVKKALEQQAPVEPVFSDGDFPRDITKIEIIDNVVKSGKKNILIYYKPKTFWDETDFVKRVGGTAIQVGSVLFANSKVEDIALFAQTEMTDQYGKTSLDVGTSIWLSREMAKKVDWKGLADRHAEDPTNIYHLAEKYYIHPGILKNVNPNCQP